VRSCERLLLILLVLPATVRYLVLEKTRWKKDAGERSLTADDVAELKKVRPTGSASRQTRSLAVCVLDRC